jgi:hypothetical protein
MSTMLRKHGAVTVPTISNNRITHIRRYFTLHNVTNHERAAENIYRTPMYISARTHTRAHNTPLYYPLPINGHHTHTHTHTHTTHTHTHTRIIRQNQTTVSKCGRNRSQHAHRGRQILACARYRISACRRTSVLQPSTHQAVLHVLYVYIYTYIILLQRRSRHNINTVIVQPVTVTSVYLAQQFPVFICYRRL